MDVLFVTTELFPWAKVGGLADVAAALPKALRGLGHRVTVVLPKFRAFDEGDSLLLARRLSPITFRMGSEDVSYTVFDGRLPSQIELCLVDMGDVADPSAFYDDGPRAATLSARFSKAAVEIAKQRSREGSPVDLIHANDWPTALSMHFAAIESIPGVLTIHNVSHQGVFPKSMLEEVGLTAGDFTLEGAEYFGKLSMLKQGILSAKAVTTVSPTYAREITQSSTGEGLEGVLAALPKPLLGITNGVDYAVWNPATDSTLAARYDAENTEPKARCTGALQRELGLPLDIDSKIIAFVGRLVPQKGVEELCAILPELLAQTDASFVIAGDGHLAPMVRAIAEKNPTRVVFAQAAEESLVHRIFAGANLVLVPSRYEPCGLVQQYAQRYGALPVCRATGGLKDTVVDCDAALETGTGVLYEGPDDFTAAVLRGYAALFHANHGKLVRRIMRLDHSWERAARQFERVYRASVTS